MKFRSLIAATALIGAAPLLPAAAQAPTAKISLSPSGGHVLGNPEARNRIVEYASYTCSHCATFETEASDELKANCVTKGLASFELRNLIRDPVDLTAAMLARCGTPGQFFGNHHAIMRNQNVWLTAAQSSTAETRKSWFEGSYAERMGKIARDTGLFRLMEGRGFTAQQLGQCLADGKAQTDISKMSEEGQKLGITGTPSFLLNGKLLDKVYGWAALKPLLPTVNTKS